MRLKIQHNTTYNYQKLISLNPHHFYLKPLQRNYLEVETYSLKIVPEPEGMNERYSIEGNPYFQAWFKGETESMIIQVEFQVQTSHFNPFLFLIDQWFLQQFNPEADIPFSYEPNDRPILQPYLNHTGNNLLKSYSLGKLNTNDPIQFLTQLNAAIHADWHHIIREEENLWSAAKTFAAGKGSCRDLSFMLMEMLRHVGLAARFVSGYAFNPELEEGHELHAWVETYLPGAGWVGLDPSLGLMADKHYIPLAASFLPENTLPVHGTYGGENLKPSTLQTSVSIHQI
ncbi:transglutaminase family protein [Cyclobacterium marinum]|uniref:transglutaminase family protein n=1 Tax=Cyclobacterium marinum TaxID=104 RepID=UPI0011ED73CD|nr:transglutaminase family protein [Cyclobacterium marinum]MBI0399028.1 transglutaminase family protein [Cyclobacterium marinum]